jgi:hypothetical protein
MMPMRALIVMTVIVETIVSVSSQRSGPGGVPAPVAIVSALEGSASIQEKRGQRPLALYDWVNGDVTVDVAAGGRLELTLIDGRRYALGAGARVKLSENTLTKVRGEVTEQSSLPQLLSLAPIAGPPPRAAGAVRVRGRGVSKLNPCESVRTLRDRTILRFQPIDGAVRYVVEVRDNADSRVFAATVDQSPVTIPPALLAAGAAYVWTVRTEGSIPPATSTSRFSTVDASVEAARGALASSSESTALGLLGGIDLHLGLLNEAVAELTTASERTPMDVATRAVLERARAALAGSCP